MSRSCAALYTTEVHWEIIVTNHCFFFLLPSFVFSQRTPHKCWKLFLFVCVSVHGGDTEQSSPVDQRQLRRDRQTGVHANEWVLVEGNLALCGAVGLPAPAGGRACVRGAAPVEYHFSGIWFQNRLWHQVSLIMRHAAGWPAISVLSVCARYSVTVLSKCILPWL